MTLTSLLLDVAREIVSTLRLAAPFLLIGLALAGFGHVLLSRRFVERFLGRRGLSGAFFAAAVGTPLPICSCGVVPMAIELRRKGASRASTSSFLITTPESGIDSIALSWGLLGPLMAIVRPVSALISALVAAIFVLFAFERRRSEAPGAETDPSKLPQPEDHHGHHHDHGDHHGHDHHHDHGDHHDHDHHSHSHTSPLADEDQAAAARAELRKIGPYLFKKDKGEPEEAATSRPALWQRLFKPALRYSFIELADDIIFWLVVGVVAAAAFAVILPPDPALIGLGGGWKPMLALLLIGIPLYVCASAATPLGAVLLLKGFSPGAVLVFLLAGPATNLAALILLSRAFGRRFVACQLAGVVIGALGCGLLLDELVRRFDWSINVPSATAGMSPSLFEQVGLALLVLLIAWRFWAGAFRRGVAEVRANLRVLTVPIAAFISGRAQRLAPVGAVLALSLFLAAGFSTIPSGSVGFRSLFGRVDQDPIAPGLSWHAPWPLGRIDIWRVDYPRKADIGFRTDLGLVATRRQLTLRADPASWHSVVAAMNPDSELASFLTADENLLELSFTVAYKVIDPLAFFYRGERDRDVVGLYAETIARELVATRQLDELLTTDRQALETAIAAELGNRLEVVAAGVAITSVRIVDIHPPGETVFVFRDVSSAREDRETRIHQAHEQAAAELPRARGQAARQIAIAQAAAQAGAVEATGQAEGFLAQTRAFASQRTILRHLLWLESAERQLGGRTKIILPRGAQTSGFSFWRDMPPLSAEPPRRPIPAAPAASEDSTGQDATGEDH